MDRRALTLIVAVAAVSLAHCGGSRDEQKIPPQQAATSAPVSRPGSSPSPSEAVAEGAKTLQVPEVSIVSTEIGHANLPPARGELRISGDRRHNSWFITAERIVFEPNARLIFTKQAMDRPNLFILAKEIVAVSDEHPGTITWEQMPLDVPGQPGSASPGSDHGSHEGIPGGDGGHGLAGAQGERGREAPHLTLVAMRVGSPVNVELKGQDGGSGGQGQHGGRGGGGGHGNNAAQKIHQCARGCGKGFPGGRGGNGGPGGTGGTGGYGGTFTLIAPENAIAVASRMLRVSLAGGNGGPGGNGGSQGAGGAGGKRGAEAKPYCKDDCSDGPAGPAGQTGGTGPLGDRGKDGDYFVGGLAPESIQTQLLKIK